MGFLQLFSCLGDSDDSEFTIADDAQLYTFSLSNDSFPALAKVVFTIDQKNNLVYNHDSMAYLTAIDTTVKVTYTCAMTSYDSGAKNFLIPYQGDSIWLTSGDTVNIAKLSEFSIFSPMGEEKKYKFQLNIHQVDPDSVQYLPVNAGVSLDFLKSEGIKIVLYRGDYYAYVKTNSSVALYGSSDLQNWTERSVVSIPADLVISSIQVGNSNLFGYAESGGLYACYDDNAADWQLLPSKPIVTFLGFLEKTFNHNEGLAVIVNEDGKNVFAFHDGEWKYGDEVSGDFPLSGFSVISNTSVNVQQLTVVAINGVWATQNGLYWTKRNNGSQYGFPSLEGANAFPYDNEIYLINGRKKASDSYNKEVYFSIDGGITWKIKPLKYSPPETYPLRRNASVVVDKTNTYFYILGGRNDEILTDTWKVFQNKKVFE